MNRRKPFRIGIVLGSVLLAGMLVGSVDQTPVSWMRTVLLGTLGAQIPEVSTNQFQKEVIGEQPLQIAARRLPGAKDKSPQEVELEKLPKPLPPGQVKRHSKAELLDACLNQPKCRAKHEKAVAGKGQRPKNALPGLREESPQDKELQLLPQPQNPQSSPRGPKSDLFMPETSSGLLSWLNPFGASIAHAATPVNIHLTPGGGYVGGNYVAMYGAYLNPNGSNYLYSSWSNSQFASYSNNLPFAYVRFYVASGGYYDLSFKATNGKMKLRHQYNGPIIEEWDFSTPPTGWPGLYATKEWLDPGYHYFYFFQAPGSNYVRFDAVDITSWP